MTLEFRCRWTNEHSTVETNDERQIHDCALHVEWERYSNADKGPSVKLRPLWLSTTTADDSLEAPYPDRRRSWYRREPALEAGGCPCGTNDVNMTEKLRFVYQQCLPCGVRSRMDRATS